MCGADSAFQSMRQHKRMHPEIRRQLTEAVQHRKTASDEVTSFEAHIMNHLVSDFASNLLIAILRPDTDIAALKLCIICELQIVINVLNMMFVCYKLYCFTVWMAAQSAQCAPHIRTSRG